MIYSPPSPQKEYGVVILCCTYNQELYIEKAILGFISQKTDFPFCAMLVDDCSTDSTSSIIRRYEQSYPELIKGFYLPENHHSLKKKKYPYYKLWFEHAEYIAFCEGDDYWTDSYKLQKQYNALKNNGSCYMCVHRTRLIASDSLNVRTIPDNYSQNGVIDKKILFSVEKIFRIHTSSFFVNSKRYQIYLSEKEVVFGSTPVGDLPLLLYFGYIGDIYYLNDSMSSYRLLAQNSWSMRLRNDKDRQIELHQKLIFLFENFKTFTKGQLDDYCQYKILKCRFVIEKLKGNYKSLFSSEFRPCLKSEPYKMRLYFFAKAFLPFIFRKNIR